MGAGQRRQGKRPDGDQEAGVFDPACDGQEQVGSRGISRTSSLGPRTWCDADSETERPPEGVAVKRAHRAPVDLVDAGSVVVTGTSSSRSPVFRPWKRPPLGSVTVTEESRAMTGSLNRRVTTPGAATSSEPGLGVEETKAA